MFFFFSTFLSHVSLAYVALLHIATLRCLLTPAPSVVLSSGVLPHNPDPLLVGVQ